jgi:hypothetical protein
MERAVTAALFELIEQLPEISPEFVFSMLPSALAFFVVCVLIVIAVSKMMDAQEQD